MQTSRNPDQLTAPGDFLSRQNCSPHCGSLKVPRNSMPCSARRSFSRATVSWWPPSPRAAASSGPCLPALPSQAWPHNSCPSTSHGSIFNAVPDTVPAPHNFVLLGEGAVTVPPDPPGRTPFALSSSSNTVWGQDLSSTRTVHRFGDPTRSQMHPQPVEVLDIWAPEGAGGPAVPGAKAGGEQNDGSIVTSPLPASILG